MTFEAVIFGFTALRVMTGGVGFALGPAQPPRGCLPRRGSSGLLDSTTANGRHEDRNGDRASPTEHRRRGFGEQIYQRGLAKAWELGAQVIETVVLESNDDGLRFARHHGFVEIERYLLPEHTIPFVDLRLT